MNETVCERVDRLSKEKGLSRRQLAILAKISPSTLQSAMQRNKNLSLDLLFPISDVLGVDIHELQYGYPLETTELPEEMPNYKLTDFEKCLSEFFPLFLKLNRNGRKVALERIKELCEIPRYQEKNVMISMDEREDENAE